MAVMGASLENAGIERLALLLQQGMGAEKAALPVTSRRELSNNAKAHDPPKCERFGDKIMRPLIYWGATGHKPVSTFAGRAPGDQHVQKA
jgi:hypothetical protein